MSAQPEVAPGWYQDPWDASHWRWWDGAQWTGNTSPMQSGAQASQLAHTAAVSSVPATQQQAAPAHEQAPRAQLDRRWHPDRYIVRQKVRAMVNRYEVYEPAPATVKDAKPREGMQVAVVQQKRLALREKISFKDERDQDVLTLQARKVLEVRGKYDLHDPDGNLIGSLQKVFGKSLFRSSWKLFDAEGRHVASAQEDSMIVALFRRFGGLLPYASYAIAFIPYGFELTAGSELPAGSGMRTGAQIGSHRRRIGFRDVYDLDLRGDTAGLIDRRLGVALAVGLDALQGR